MLSSTMGKEPDLLQAIKTEDIRGLTRLLTKYKSTRPKLLGSGKRLNINVQDCDGMSGLHQAALMCNVSIIQLLLDAGAQVDIKDHKGMRPLHYAAWQGKRDPVSLLLQYNASVNEQACKGETPLHLACQHGHASVTQLLLEYHSNVLIRNKDHKSPLDLACEFGHYQVVDFLLRQQAHSRCRSLLSENPQDTADNDRTTCLHLAARNGHIDVIRLLLNAGIDINRSTLRGTALHEAAMHGKLNVVKMLIESGVDVNKPNSYDQTALDIVRSFTTCHAEREMKHLLKEIINAVQAKAIRDFDNPSDPSCLPLKEGQHVTVLEQRADGCWRGIVFHANYTSQSGYFPATAVQLLDRPVGGVQRTGTLKSGTIKKVPPPVVPDLSYRNSGSSFSSGYGSQATVDRNSCGSLGTDEPVSPPPNSPNSDPMVYGTLPSPSKLSHFCFPDVQSQYTQVIVHAQPNGSQPTTPVDSAPGPLGSTSVCHAMLEDQGIDVCPSPGGSSASGTSSRHSMSSVDSGRASGSDKMVPQKSHTKHIHPEVPSHRHSYHSSTSSVSSDELQILGTNVAEMILHGVPDPEILSAWLTSLKFEEYCSLFLQAGYDMPTISRMTPEDLTAIGITKPNHRRKLKAEIARLNISDGIPDYKPNSLLEWLNLLRLEEYYETLCEQGYDSVDKVTDLTWEDLEEIGIQKLGHQKKITLAIKRIKDITNGIKRTSHIPDTRELGSGVSNSSSRPTTLGSVPPYSYHTQEIAITTARSRLSPSTNDSGLEFKTFQQSPPKEDGFQHYIGRECDSPSHRNLYQPNVVTIQVRSTSRGRSLESLDMDDSVSTVMHQPYYGNNDCWYDTVSAWRQHGYDTDSELSVHEHYSYETDGTVTLNRPRGMVKPRPVAKITAKTRQSDPESHYDFEDDPKCLDKIANHVIDSWSPQHTWSNVNAYGTLRGKRNPPMPPKRTNSIKSERSIEAMKDEAFATCVKGLASRFIINRDSDLPPPPSDGDRSASPALTEDFPPPPSPLSSVMDLVCKEEEVCAKETGPKFRQRRKDSADSNISTSSTESNSLPFANENVGTIKQRAVKCVTGDNSPAASPSSTLRKSSLPSHQACASGKRNSAAEKRMLNDSIKCGRAMDEHHSGATDVIVDIENMLANLSTQLDAMLEYQLNDG